jgi:hypothetical protein
MFNVYSEKVPAGEAWEIIFSGKEPCCICDFVTTCKKENENAWNQWQSQKLVLILKQDRQALAQSPANGKSHVVESGWNHPRRFEDLKTPPPKAILG